ncbi:hypothetical protein AAMO2058_000827600 [Amorphochlora amoebiformis]|mmetsp:Transcript_7306/g.11343  ORF Transcript_7306/g.11343 Transcript_7306/m.11343 type:complete len:333 (-) Transcript_7306:176-1174(-)
MKAAIISSFDKSPWDKLDVKKIDIPKPKSTEVLVKVHTAALNPIDGAVANGYAIETFKWGWNGFPFTIAYDMSGTVEAVGSDVKDFKKGQEVFAVQWGKGNHGVEGDRIGGTLAEYCVIPASKLSFKPKEVSHEEAAAIALVGTTAYQSSSLAGEIKEGDVCVVLGGAGSVGSLAIQFLKKKKATVIATCSERSDEYVKSLGADYTVNYKKDDWTQHELVKKGGIKLVLMASVNPGTWDKAKTLFAKGGAYVELATAEANMDSKFDKKDFAHAGNFVLSNDKSVQDMLVDSIAKKQLKQRIAKARPFTKKDIQEAFNAMNHGGGKQVIKIIN